MIVFTFERFIDTVTTSQIGYIAGLDSLVSLKILDLSFNRIRKIGEFSNLPFLGSVDS